MKPTVIDDDSMTKRTVQSVSLGSLVIIRKITEKSQITLHISVILKMEKLSIPKLSRVSLQIQSPGLSSSSMLKMVSLPDGDKTVPVTSMTPKIINLGSSVKNSKSRPK